MSGVVSGCLGLPPIWPYKLKVGVPIPAKLEGMPSLGKPDLGKQSGWCVRYLVGKAQNRVKQRDLFTYLDVESGESRTTPSHISENYQSVPGGAGGG